MGYTMTVRCVDDATRDALLAFLEERRTAENQGFWPDKQVLCADADVPRFRRPSLGLHVSIARAAD